MLKKNTMRRLACVLILLSLLSGLLGGCSRVSLLDLIDFGVYGEAEFDQLMDELFIEYVSSDSLMINYNLADPGRFGIEMPDPPTFGEVTSAESIQRSNQENQELREQLAGFRYGDLRVDQQIVYDILERNLFLSEVTESNEDFSYYLGAFFPIAGVHVQLPVLLVEFRFYTVEDIEIYLRLLEDTRRYFNDLLEFERERSRRGFFMSDGSVDEVIAHCESFLENPEENIMIVVVNDKIDRYEGLTGAQRDEYKRRNRELVLGYVLPAYEDLLRVMRELRGVGAHQGGLASLPNGEYFSQAYLQHRTGTDIPPERMEIILIDAMSEMSAEIGMLMQRNPELMEKFFNDELGQIRGETHLNYLKMLEAAIARDFPPMRPAQYVVHEVHESMQDFMSPAFYLIPALDHYEDNVIYVNPANDMDNIQLFTMLAHEGYPGHLYQTVYYLQQSPHPLRTVLYNLGYIEGWATYGEYQSYYLAGLNEAEASLARLARLFDMLFITRIDLGVNALGWDLARVAAFCRQYGIEGTEAAEEIFQLVIGYPLHFVPYTVGYLEMTSMREEASAALGNAFDPLEFHRFILDFGPAPFPLIQRHLREWIREQ